MKIPSSLVCAAVIAAVHSSFIAGLRAEAASNSEEFFDESNLSEWKVTGNAKLRVENEQLVIEGAGQVISKPYKVNLTHYPYFATKVSAATGLYNITVGVGTPAVGTFQLRAEQPAEKEAVLSPQLSGDQWVTVMINTVDGKTEIDYFRFLSESASSLTPPATAGEGGRLEIDIPLDEAELARWNVIGDIKTSSQEGKLVFNGQGRIERTFLLEDAKCPVLLVDMQGPVGVFNIGTSVDNAARADFFRDDKAGSKEAPLSGIEADATGPHKVTVDILLTGGTYELSEIKFLAP